ncbi:MAG: magnesium transporter [Bacteroidia bacterium]
MAKTRIGEYSRIERISRLIQAPNAHITRLVSMLHPTELAQLLEDCDEEIQQKVVRHLPRELVSRALAEMDEETNPGELLLRLHPRAAADLVQELDPDDATDLLSQIDEQYRERILHHIPDEEEEVINQLLTYDEESAGGLMNPEAVQVRTSMSMLQATRAVVEQSEEVEEFYYIYVVDDDDVLVGYLTFKKLFRTPRNVKVEDVMVKDIESVEVDTDQEEVARRMSQFNLPTLPVVDAAGKLLGRVTFDDVMDVMEEESTEDILSFAGVSDDADLRGGWANSVKSRVPWLLINLATASTAAFVISRFEDTLSQITALAFFMPVIAGVAGNGATQTLAVTLRRLSTDGIPPSKALGVILKEVTVGTINGLMIGAIASIVAISTNADPLLGLVVFLALFGNLVISGLVGSFFPILLERLGIDPAVASSIFITAFTDILGYTLLFGLGTMILL